MADSHSDPPSRLARDTDTEQLEVEPLPAYVPASYETAQERHSPTRRLGVSYCRLRLMALAMRLHADSLEHLPHSGVSVKVVGHGAE